METHSVIVPEYLSADELDSIIQRALAEDVGAGDVTTLATVPESTVASGILLCKESGVIAGVSVVSRVFHRVDSHIEVRWAVGDGDRVDRHQTLAKVEGPARGVLTGERTALNLLQRMSGIATLTDKMVSLARPHGAEILDTRKTAPGLRCLDKWAVRIGGGRNHRLGLFDMILVKDNHIAVAGGLRPAIEGARQFARHHPDKLDIEVEVRTLEEVSEALEVGGIDILLLDNMVTVDSEGAVDTSMLSQAVAMVGGACKTEASGNVNLHTVGSIAATGVDYISCGALTHSVSALDISLKLEFHRGRGSSGNHGGRPSR